ncbi:hypothetical protein KQY30_07200 [Streptomyces sp. GMY02]|uniref:hypothetical protein n=1 Tax=Streptomyces sp. GMY02 TaxID=1333528 RepID=UPI001C2BECBF|nr:hypothetical protein [Streptomyces sp. GMY02]QXE39634.1 hypothetical protein KQY30_07200 [Streptomyces sp. GMY02]
MEAKQRAFTLDGLPSAGGGAVKALASAKKTHPGSSLETQWELFEIDKAELMGRVDFYPWNRRLGDWTPFS